MNTKLTCTLSRKAKLGLTAQGAGSTVYFFPEGLFIRAYNESAYIVTKLLNIPLKVTVTYSKQLDCRPILYCGFQYDRIKHYFGDVKLNEYGYYTVHGTFELLNYQLWVNNEVKRLAEQLMQMGTGNSYQRI